MELRLGDSSLPFVNAGNGGYKHLHKLRGTIGAIAPDTGVQLIAANDQQHGI
jgi:hypothetical protein